MGCAWIRATIWPNVIPPSELGSQSGLPARTPRDAEVFDGMLDPPRRGSMFHRISTKLVVAVLAAVVLPFVAFAFYMNEKIADRLTRHVVQQALMGLVKDLAGQIDRFVEERTRDLEQWAESPVTRGAIEDHLWEVARVRSSDGDEGTPEGMLPPWNARTIARWRRGEFQNIDFDDFHPHRARTTLEFDRYIRLKEVYDLVLLVASDGSLVTCSSGRPGGALSEEFLEFLFAQDFSREEWFLRALQGERMRIDHHRSAYYFEVPDADPAREYQLGFAAPVVNPRRGGEVQGVLFALVNWKFVQDLVDGEVITDAFRGLVSEDKKPSPYAWIWDSDADTILGHPQRELYYQSVSRDVKLPQMTEAVLASDTGWGLFPEYTFKGEDKNAAFKRCIALEGDAPGWVIGVGINNDDIYATAEELRALLFQGTSGVVLLSVLLTLFIAKRTTKPIRELQRTSRRVAEGDLDARTKIKSRDELGSLADDFDRMTRKLKEQQERIIKAEKAAAWREMARQIAHDIKNPLTPMSLSLDLLERARRERSEGVEEILERTIELIRRQIDNLREIAGDFYEFTGGRKPQIETIDLTKLVEEVLHLHDAWAVEQGVEVHLTCVPINVTADLGKLRRVLVNLVTNALQAMSEGGQLFVETALSEGVANRANLSIRDTGTGVSEEVAEHLFEPFFTTRTEGTGLGLAISKRVLEEMDGTIELVPADGRGTIARVSLKLDRGSTEAP